MLDIRYCDLTTVSAAERSAKTTAFYEQIYQDAFSHIDQVESPANWLPLMNQTDRTPRVHIIVACESDDVLGGVVFEHYPISNCWLLSYLAVRPDVRHLGIATGLIKEVVTILNQQSDDWILFAESENPAKMSAGTRVKAVQRLPILDRLGMRRLMLDYVMPKLAAEKQMLDDLMLLCYDPHQTVQLPAERLADYLTEFYTSLDQATAPALTKMLASIQQQTVSSETLASAKHECVGPQDGAPKCPCAMAKLELAIRL